MQTMNKSRGAHTRGNLVALTPRADCILQATSDGSHRHSCQLREVEHITGRAIYRLSK